MTEYKGIKGFKVQSLSSDPSEASDNSGQIWYNTTSNALKYTGGIGAWSSGGALNTARYGIVGTGTQTAAIAFGGYSAPPSTYYNKAETYNGSSWTEVTGMGTTAWLRGRAGTQTAALATGGGTPPDSRSVNSESWNGSA